MSSFSNVGSRLVDGNLHFFSKTTGNDLLVLDPVNETVTIPADATLMIGADTITEFVNDLIGG